MIPHPFGLEKKRLLTSLPEDVDVPSLHALFPELRLQGLKVRGARLRTVIAQHLVEGDRSAQTIREARQELERLGLWTRTGTETAFVIEEIRDSQRAAAFLAGHYYRTAMFAWFWRVYDLVRDRAIQQLRHFALDVACFDGKSVEEVRGHFANCLQSAKSHTTRQRLWNKLGVLFTYREEFAEAQEALEQALAMLPEVPRRGEQLCRMAEWHNANALVFYRQSKWSHAFEELERAEACLTGMDDCPRAQSIRALLDSNRNKLKR